jgi:hypothetical protein
MPERVLTAAEMRTVLRLLYERLGAVPLDVIADAAAAPSPWQKSPCFGVGESA